MKKIYHVGILGATGLVGQTFITMLHHHPYFQVTALASSGRHEGKSYEEVVGGDWGEVGKLPILNTLTDRHAITKEVDFVFSAIGGFTPLVGELEEAYALLDCPVISCSSAHRHTKDVPMVIPELNPQHLQLIPWQKKRLGTKKGFMAVKSNCSLQNYLPPLFPLMDYAPKEVVVSTYQSVSGGGKTLSQWEEMNGNIIPYIVGEEEKSHTEPLKILGDCVKGEIRPSNSMTFSVQCVRVPTEVGHLATVGVNFRHPPTMAEIRKAWADFSPKTVTLPTAPKIFLPYEDDPYRPQLTLDKDREQGMAITIGGLREDPLFHCRFVTVSHNLKRGAAGGAILLAELLEREGYLQ